MRLAALATALLIAHAAPAPAHAEILAGVAVQLPGVSVHLGLPARPDMRLIPGLPVYYAPQVRANYFFYDGLYWVFQADAWYFSTWYGGPWFAASPYDVPAFVLRVPVRYFRSRPVFFRDWSPAAPPRWGDVWGREWRVRRDGWDRWDHRHPPAAAPLPFYQRRFPAPRYPDSDLQRRALRGTHDDHRPLEPMTRRAIERQRQLEQDHRRPPSGERFERGHRQPPGQRDR